MLGLLAGCNRLARWDSGASRLPARLPIRVPAHEFAISQMCGFWAYTRSVMSATGLPASARVAIGVAALLAVALVPAARAAAVTPPEPGAAAALASGRVIGLSHDACGENQVMSAISDDRGATWSAGGCVPDGSTVRPDSDGVSISYITNTGQALVQLDANGGVSASWSTAPYTVSDSSGVDGSQAFMWSYLSGLVSVSAAGQVPCGAIPPTIVEGTQRVAGAIGPLVVVSGRSDGGSAAFAISSDSCASFTTVSADSGGCLQFSLQPDGGIVCVQDHGSVRLDAHAPAAGWAPTAPIALPSQGQYGFGLARGGLEVHALDAFSTNWAPWTWPKPVRTLAAIPGGTPPPRGAMSSALAYLNTRYRRPMGLASAVWQPQVALSAQRHTDYWVKNGTGTGLQPHGETPGKPGFYGVTAADRCKAAGVPAAIQCGEDAAPYRTTPLAAMAVLLALPYHGVPLLSALHLGVGMSSAGVAVEMDWSWNVDQAAGVNVYDYDAVPNTPSATEHVWPFDGAENVPSAGGHGEVPDPLAGYTGNHANVGPILFFSTLNSVQVTLKTASGATVPLLAPPPVFTKAVRHGLVQSVTTKGGFATEAVFAGQALDPGAKYTLVLSPELPGLPEHRFTFTVAGSTHRPSSTRRKTVPTKIAGCRERLIPTRRAGGGRTAFQFVASGCKPQTLQVYRAKAWRVVRPKTIVVGYGARAFWRVVYQGRVIASGVLYA